MKEINKLLQAQFDKMCVTGKLFRSRSGKTFKIILKCV